MSHQLPDLQKHLPALGELLLRIVIALIETSMNVIDAVIVTLVLVMDHDLDFAQKHLTLIFNVGYRLCVEAVVSLRRFKVDRRLCQARQTNRTFFCGPAG